jgi:Immunoglobulin I-set domain
MSYGQRPTIWGNAVNNRVRWLMATAIFLAAGCGGAAASAPDAPSILLSPASIAANACDAVELVVEAAGAEPLAYQWLKNGTPVPGATAAVYTFQTIDISDAGSYSVAITNSQGTVTSSLALVTVTVPPPSALPTLVANESGGDLAIQDGFVVWSVGGYMHATSTRCPGLVKHLLDVPFIAPSALLPDGHDSVIWMDGNPESQGIFSTSLVDGQSSMLARTASQYGGMAAANGLLIWTNREDQSIQSMPLSGGPINTVSVTYQGTFDGPLTMTVDGEFIYWTQMLGTSLATATTVINRMPIGGGPIVQLAADQGNVYRMAADGADLFWIATGGTGTSQTSFLRKVNRGGGDVQTLGQRTPGMGSDLLLDGDRVFWTVDPAGADGVFSGSGSLYEVPKDGSAPPTLLQDGLSLPGGMAVDGPYLYWGESTFEGGLGRVMRMIKP